MRTSALAGTVLMQPARCSECLLSSSSGSPRSCASRHEWSRMKSAPGDGYDVVVVGSGIGGLCCAVLLAHAGCKVLIAEQHQSVGGYAHAYRHGDFTIDPAVHLIGDPTLFERLLGHVGMAGSCTFLTPESLYSIWLPDFHFHAPLGSPAEFIAAYAEALPDAADEVTSFFELCAQVHREAHQLPAA